MSRNPKHNKSEPGQYGNYVDYMPEADGKDFRQAMVKMLNDDMRKTCDATGLKVKRGTFKIIWGPPRWIYPEEGAPFLAATAAWKANLI